MPPDDPEESEGWHSWPFATQVWSKGLYSRASFQESLCIAFQTLICINQINVNTRVLGPKRVGLLVHKVIYGTSNDNKTKNWCDFIQ